MKAILAILLVVLLGTISADANKRMSNIVGGSNATTNQFPFMVSLQIGNSLCGGFLLSPTHVGTAAHCFSANTTAASITAQAGTTDISVGTNGQSRGASSFKLHPLYNTTSLEYDAAIITLSSAFNVDGVSLKIAPLATNTSQLPPAGQTVYVAGWGLTSTGGSISNNLLFVGLPYQTLNTCIQTYGPLLTGVQICAGGVVGQDSCQGDSGGPLFTTATPNNPTDAVIIGIVSFGGSACAVNEPGVYSNVPGFAAAYFQSIIDQSASGVPSSGAVASSSGVVAASSKVVVASSASVAASSGVVAASSGVVAASSGAVAASSGAVAASSGAVAVSSSKVVAASSSKVVAASSSKVVAASSGAAAVSSSKVVAASSQVVAASSSKGVVAASSGAVAASSGAVAASSQVVAASSGVVAASSGAVAASSQVVAASSIVAASSSGSRQVSVKTLTGLAAINCRTGCQRTFRNCKQTTRRIRVCRKAKKVCVRSCGIINPQ